MPMTFRVRCVGPLLWVAPLRELASCLATCTQGQTGSMSQFIHMGTRRRLSVVTTLVGLGCGLANLSALAIQQRSRAMRQALTSREVCLQVRLQLVRSLVSMTGLEVSPGRA